MHRPPGRADVVKLASNENPRGISPKALAAIKAALPENCDRNSTGWIHPGIEVWGGCHRALIEDNRIDHWLSYDSSDGGAARHAVRVLVVVPTRELAIQVDIF